MSHLRTLFLPCYQQFSVSAAHCTAWFQITNVELQALPEAHHLSRPASTFLHEYMLQPAGLTRQGAASPTTCATFPTTSTHTLAKHPASTAELKDKMLQVLPPAQPLPRGNIHVHSAEALESALWPWGAGPNLDPELDARPGRDVRLGGPALLEGGHVFVLLCWQPGLGKACVP